MQPQVPQTKPTNEKGNIGFIFGIIQSCIIGLSLLMFAMAGPESEASGAFFGFGGMLVAFLAVLFGPVSLTVFIVTTMRGQLFRNPTAKFIWAAIFQLANVAYMAYGIVVILQLFRWNS